MTTHRWTELKANAQRLFNNDSLWPETERDLVEHFKADPERVAQAIDKIAGDINKGIGPRAPWAVLRKNLSEPPLEAIVEVDDRATAIRRAEKRIRNLGTVIEDEYELNEALYAPGEPLAPWATDQQLRQRMVDLWQQRSGQPSRYDRIRTELAAQVDADDPF